MALAPKHLFKFALLGNPVEHSMAKEVFEHLGSVFDISLTYDLINVEGTEPKDILFKLAKYDAVNITYPLKRIAAATIGSSLDYVSAIERRDNKFYGFDLDGISLTDSLYAINLEVFDNWRILIMGSGSTALSIANCLRRHNLRVTMITDKVERVPSGICFISPNYNKIVKPYDIIINATSLVAGEIPYKDMIADTLHEAKICIDVNYRGEQAFLKLAEEQGVSTIMDGRRMLLHQLARNFGRFTKCRATANEITMEALKKFGLE